MRTDYDSLGPVDIPDDALYSANTVRGAKNFHLIGRPISDYPAYIVAMAKIKKAAARANLAAGGLDASIADAIMTACDEIVAGQHQQNFIVTLAEGSGGTSTNMNFNEVIANRAGQLLGDPLGRFARVHPNDHVNLSQSTNDVLPSAVKLACVVASGPMVVSARQLASAFRGLSEAYRDHLRVGRTCMQAAQPMTYGQLFNGYASFVARAADAVETQRKALTTVPMGGTAIGTGLGMVPGYRDHIAAALTAEFGFEVTLPEDYFDAMQAADGFARFSGEVKVLAETMGKIAGDLVILASGKNSGIGEIILPSVQPGSSIMAGKVNPVIPMMVQQVAFMAQGYDATVSIAAMNGQMEINHFEPIIAHALFNAIDLTSNGCEIFRRSCIEGLRVDSERSYENLANSFAMSTVFLRKFGYSKVSILVKEAEEQKIPLAEHVISLGLLSRSDVRKLLQRASAGDSFEWEAG